MKQEEKKSDLNIFFESYTDEVIEFQLYMEHTFPESQRIEALINYY